MNFGGKIKMEQNTRLFRSIARLNLGGPGRHCLWLLDLDRLYQYQTKLVYGEVEINEEELPIPKELNEKTLKLQKLKRSLGTSDILTFFTILFQIFKFKPHIIHTHTSKAGFHGRLAGVLYNLICKLTFRKGAKIVHTFHGHTFRGYFGKLLGFIFLTIERIWCKYFTNKIIVISAKQFDEIHNTFKVGNKDQFQIVKLGIDTSRFSDLTPYNNQFRQELNIPKDVKMVALVSRIAPIKNHLMFIDVCKNYLATYDDKIRFIIVGGGSQEEEEKIQNHIKAHNLGSFVICTGNRIDLESIYASLDCVCLTSLNEGTPVSLIEAMSSKIPCISTNVGGVADVLGDNRGVLIENFDILKYTQELRTLLYDREVRQANINKAYEYVINNHSKEILLNNINSLYGNLLK